MIVYGDRTRIVGADEALDSLVRSAARAALLPAGVERHGLLAGLLVEAGTVAQALADRALEACGEDGPDPAAGAAMALCVALARALVASWRTGFAAAPLGLDAPLRALRSRLPAAALALRTPEGFAHYAVYPEAYAESAAALAGEQRVRVLGIRSIGTSLAAAVAAALGAGVPLTVRPVGHPFARTLALAPALRASLRPRDGEVWAVVDEGPGLSGSSFAAAAGALEAAAVPPDRVHLFPSHAGPPGAAAGDGVRAHWERWPRHPAAFERIALGPRGLAAWVADVTGPLDGPPEDLGGGRWRLAALGPAAAWPPAFRQQERRKYLLSARGACWLAEFVGLGRVGEARFARACALGDAGLAPPPAALRHGFLVRRWVDAAPLSEAVLPAERLVTRLAAYLAFRAKRLPAAQGEGAAPAALLEMARANAAEALGPDAAREVDRLAPAAEAAAGCARPVAVDAKLEPWEWLVLPDGTLWKADAVQHADGHDVVGAQDVAWDVAGARVELGLDRDAGRELAARVRRATGLALREDVLAFHEIAWLAFRLGRWTLARAAEEDVAERARIDGAVARYADLLRRRLGRAPDQA